MYFGNPLAGLNETLQPTFARGQCHFKTCQKHVKVPHKGTTVKTYIPAQT
jgi:hypothetical protein